MSFDVFALVLVKRFLFFIVSSAGDHRYTSIYIKKNPIMESAEYSQQSFRKMLLVDKLLKSWSRQPPHGEPETGTIWQFTRLLILCWGERPCAKLSFQSYIPCGDYRLLLHCWCWIRWGEKKKKVLRCLLVAPFHGSSSVHFIFAPYRFPRKLTTL